MKIVHWLIIIAAWVGFTGLTHWLHQRQPPGGLVAAEFSLMPPGPGAVFQPVRLPHAWRDSPDSGHATTGWYRLRFSHEAGDQEPQALLLWQLSMNAAVWLNGMRIGDGGSMVEPVARNWFRPLLLSAPESLLRAGANELLIELRAVPAGSGFLGPVYAGRLTSLRSAFEQRHFLKVTFLQLLCVLFLVMALPTGILWFKRRQDSIYLCHAAAALFSALYIFIIVAGSLPGQSLAPFWEWLRVTAIGFAILCITMLIHRYVGLRPPRVESLLWAFEISCAAALLLYGLWRPEAMQQLVNRVWEPLVVGVGGYPALLMFKAYATKPDRPGFWLMITGNLLLILGVHDLLMINGLIAPFDGFYVTYGGAGPLIAFTGILMERFLHALRDSETLNAELVSRVEQKSAELAQAYAQKQQLENASLLAEERSRLLMDMHDGLGGQLVSTLARLENAGESQGAAAASVREALADLRLIIYSLEPSANDLGVALALVRGRLDAVCTAAGLQLHWQQAGLPEACELGPRATLDVMRVVQEAVSNALKHAQASELRVRAYAQQRDAVPGIAVEIQDNGRGMAVATPAGKGLGHLARRAARLGGQLDIEAASPGCRVRLWFPWPPRATP